MSFKAPSLDLLKDSSSSDSTPATEAPIDKRFQSIVTPAEEIEDETPFVWQQDQPTTPPKVISSRIPTDYKDLIDPLTFGFILVAIIAIVILIVYFFVGF